MHLKIGPLSFNSDHNNLRLDLICSYSINKCSRVKDTSPYYKKAKIYAKEIENHLLKLFLGNYVKRNSKHMKDIIVEVGYQCFQMHVGRHKKSRSPCKYWFGEECEMYLKLHKFAKGENERAIAWHQYIKIVRRKKREHFHMQETEKKLFNLPQIILTVTTSHLGCTWWSDSLSNKVIGITLTGHKQKNLTRHNYRA